MKYARKEHFSVVFMLISAEFDTVEYSLLLETFVFLSALVSMTPSSPACLLLPCQDYFFVCYPASPSFHDVAEVLFLALFSPSHLSSSMVTHHYLNSDVDTGGFQSPASAPPIFSWAPDQSFCLSVRSFHHKVLQPPRTQGGPNNSSFCGLPTCTLAYIFYLGMWHCCSVFRTQRMKVLASY